MIIRQTTRNELHKVLAFYARCGYRGGALVSDIILCAEEQGEIRGIVRYSIEHDFHMLRGMQVDEKFHRQGIGKSLLKEFDQLVGERTCYCIPFRHLVNFYGTIGFEEIEIQDAPEHLITRLRKYHDDSLDMIIMKRLR